MSNILVEDTVRYIVTLVNEGSFEEAAEHVLLVATIPTESNLKILKKLRDCRNKNPKFMYAIEDLIAAAKAEARNKLVRTLDCCGWYGGHTGLGFIFSKPWWFKDVDT